MTPSSNEIFAHVENKIPYKACILDFLDLEK